MRTAELIRLPAPYLLAVLLTGCGGGGSGSSSSTNTVTPPASIPAPGTLSFSQASYATGQAAGSLSVAVNRNSGSAGAVAVSYATADETAFAGTDYSATSGSLQWSDGDAASKSFQVAINDSTAFDGTRSLTVGLSNPTGGAQLGPIASATATITGRGSASGGSGLQVRVQGNHLVDGSGNVLQLRGVNVSGLEFVAVQGFSPGNPWGNQTGDATPNWSTIKTWKVNVVRIPLNEASWTGYTCKDATGATRNPDPGANYKATVAATVDSATAAGLYIILDLHLTAPGKFCPLAQNQMADSDNSMSFWQAIATQFKGYPNVLFELFNEPFVGYSTAANADWVTIMQGVGAQPNYVTGGTPYQANYSWNVAGMQQMLTTVRGTGATNVVLVGAASWSQDLSKWVANKPTDPLNQMAAVWHSYPGDKDKTNPGFGSVAYTWTQSVLDAGFPVLITETGDHNTPGTVGSPFLAKLLPWADQRQVSYLGFAWDVWGNPDNVLIKDAAGDPTDGYGAYFKQHLACVSGGGSNCQ